MILFYGPQATVKSSLFKSSFVDAHLRNNMVRLRSRHRQGLLIAACRAAKPHLVIDKTPPVHAIDNIVQQRCAQLVALSTLVNGQPGQHHHRHLILSLSGCTLITALKEVLSITDLCQHQLTSHWIQPQIHQKVLYPTEHRLRDLFPKILAQKRSNRQ